MTGEEFIQALGLPEGAIVDRRVPKTLLLEHGAATSRDRTRIRDGIEEIRWYATLKPSDAGAKAYRAEDREYLEIAVIRMVLRSEAKSPRLIELFHRAVPYPMLLVTELGTTVAVSVAHIRRSRAQEGAWVLDGDVVRVDIDPEKDAPHVPAFSDAMPLTEQPRSDLRALYQGWMDTLGALLAARVSGAFVTFASSERNRQRWDALRECEAAEAEIAKLRRAAARERQMNRQIEMNLRVRELEAEYSAARSRL